ncbi:MAG: 50S ribosomal protein L18 [Deltaproteobacteria bacterium]|nr:50S ribosomal protein L18 [Deltaproteobacteria bacterium]
MSIYLNKRENRQRKIKRIRKKIFGTSERPRLSVFKSNRYFYVQLINDLTGNTLLSASTRDKDFLNQGEKIKPVEQARKLGTIFANKCKEKNIEAIVFDRRGYKYHGIIKAFADAMREAGIKF